MAYVTARIAAQRRKMIKRKNHMTRTMMAPSHRTHHIAMVSTLQEMTQMKMKLQHLSPTPTASTATLKRKTMTRNNPTKKRMMESFHPTPHIVMASTHQEMIRTKRTSSTYSRQMTILEIGIKTEKV